MFGVPRNLFRAFVAVIVNEHFGDTVHHSQRRIVGMEREPHVSLLGDWQDSLDEVSVSGPYVVGRINTIEGLLFHLAPEIVELEFTGFVTALGHDFVGGVSVRGMPVDVRYGNAKLAAVA